MQKHKEYFRRYNIFTLIYTDSNLKDIEQIFAEMQQFLRPERENKQLLEETIQEFKKFHIWKCIYTTESYASKKFYANAQS